jgi:protein-S-isoprenylcysteine O-methyltransferase Ste14
MNLPNDASPRLVLALYALYLLLAFGLRTVAHYRRTGSSGFVGMPRNGPLAARIGGLLFVAALLLGLLSPLLDLAGWARSAQAFTRPALGLALYALGLAGTLAAQFQMGASWRIGVDPAQRTELVHRGLFLWVRNPIFSAMFLIALGLMLLLPNWPALGSVACLALGLELHVRLVEEPYLLANHGEAYRRYAARVGRFFPGLGRLRP